MVAAPSANAAVVYTHMERMAGGPCCFPIGLFGARPSRPGHDLAVYAYEQGQLSRISLEVEA